MLTGADSFDPPTFHANDRLPDQRPGALSGPVWLMVQTYEAQRLIRGRRRSEHKPAIIGLIAFAELMRIVWDAARGDDPYADWWLLKVQQELADASVYMHALQAELDGFLTDAYGHLEFTVAESSRPQRVSLQFANPYAFRAAQLIGEYDRMLCAHKTLQYLGLETSPPLTERVDAGGRRLRRALASPLGYHQCAVTREDVRLSTAAALRAKERMGVLPDEILNGCRLPDLRPKILPELVGTTREGQA